MGVERGLTGLRPRRELESTDTRPSGPETAVRWFVGAFTRIFFSPDRGDGAKHRQVVAADTIPWAKRLLSGHPWQKRHRSRPLWLDRLL
jgi:hypothetical protein